VNGSKRCEAFVAKDSFGQRKPEPTQCKRFAAPEQRFCHTHLYYERRRGCTVRVTDGAFCVVCAGAARSYIIDGVTLSFCGKHGDALQKAIERGT
jgi:hypothetical protein